ncbi:hypothetical protein J6590_098005, partial [Homalodisca vitripennis]
RYDCCKPHQLQLLDSFRDRRISTDRQSDECVAQTLPEDVERAHDIHLVTIQRRVLCSRLWL